MSSQGKQQSDRQTTRLKTSEDFQHLDRANRAFINLVKRTRPAVVQITTQTRRNRIVTSRRNQLTPEEEEEFKRFFRRRAPTPIQTFF